MSSATIPASFGSLKNERIEILAKMAAQLAGFDADANMIVRVGDTVVYDGPAWKYGPHQKRAARALLALQLVPDRGP